MLALLFLAQVAAATADTSTYASTALRTLVAEAARLNRVVPPNLGRYRATVESEIAMGPRTGGGREIAISLEQVAADISWSRSGDFEQHITGYRAPAFGLAAVVGFFRTSWFVPSLYGNRIGLMWGAADTASRGAAHHDTTPPLRGVHPLAADRERYYTFSGGDTVEVIKFNGREIRIARIDVHPRDSVPPRSVVFGGELDIDVTRKHVVRMRGVFYRTGGAPNAGTAPRRRALGGPLDAFEALAFFDIINAEVQEEFWLPQYQRWELQISSPVLGAGKYVYRIVSRVHDFAITPPDSAQRALVVDSQVVRFHPITVASRDSLAAYNAWHDGVGHATSAVDADDFLDVGPERARPTGPPVATVQGERTSDIVHYNRVEGLFTGMGATLKLRDVAPGVVLRTAGGYAWSERTARGYASGSYTRGPWTWAVRGARSLDHTNDFRNPVDSGNTFSALFGVDEYDYVDRYSAGVSTARVIGKRVALVRAELGIAEDRATVSHRATGVFGDERFLPNRGIDPGRYTRTALTIDWHPAALIESAWPGLGVSVSYLRGDGDLDFQRAELRVRARMLAGPWILAARASAGMLLGNAMPPQQLFELNGDHVYKEFAGDRAVTFSGSASYHFDFLRQPFVVLGKSHWHPQLVVPGVAPMLTVFARTAWAGASNDAARAAIARLGPRTAYDPDSLAPFAPASTTTGNPRTSVGASLTFFNGFIGVGVSRAVDRADVWRARIGFGLVY